MRPESANLNLYKLFHCAYSKGSPFNVSPCIIFTLAICEGEINPNACNQIRQVSTKFGMQFKESRGYCLYPDECRNCNIYFYNAGSRCSGKLNRILIHIRRCCNLRKRKININHKFTVIINLYYFNN